MLKQNILKLLKQKDMTLLSLARKSGVPKSTLHAWTTGQVAINLVQLQAVATVLEVNFYELAFGKNDPFQDSDVELEDIFSGDVRLIVKRLKTKRSN